MRPDHAADAGARARRHGRGRRARRPGWSTADRAYEVTASLAGHTRTPARAAVPGAHGRVRGGRRAWSRRCASAGTAALVDATHPFAAVMPHHAAAAAAELGPAPGAPAPPALGAGARRPTGSRWTTSPRPPRALQDLGARRVLLTTGRLELAPFAAVDGAHMVVRTIEPPDPLPLPSATVLLDRGPYTVPGEVALLREHARRRSGHEEQRWRGHGRQAGGGPDPRRAGRDGPPARRSRRVLS